MRVCEYDRHPHQGECIWWDGTGEMRPRCATGNPPCGRPSGHYDAPRFGPKREET